MIDFFPNDFLLVLDESHVTVSQIGRMMTNSDPAAASLTQRFYRLRLHF